MNIRSMIRFLLILFVIFTVTFSYGKTTSNLQNPSNGFVKIRFIDNHENNSKTYLGKLTKGELQSLKYELQNSFAEPPASMNDKKISEKEGYVNMVTAKKLKKKWKNNSKKAKNDLVGNYEVSDEESLVEVKEKKIAQREKTISTNNKTGNYKEYAEGLNARNPNSYISKHFRQEN